MFRKLIYNTKVTALKPHHRQYANRYLQPNRTDVIKNKQLIYLPLIFFLFFINCKKSDTDYLTDFKNYEITLSNSDYDINLESGKIESDYFEITDSIKFSKNEKLQFAKLFFDNDLKNLNGDISIYNDDGISIQPDIGTSINIKYFNKEKSTISISGYADSLKIRRKYIPYLRFESKVHKILENNNEFKIIKKKINSKEDKRVYL